jgi:hypothetical protein
MTIQELIEKLQAYAREHGPECSISVYDHQGKCCSDAEIYNGNISTELRGRGEEMVW